MNKVLLFLKTVAALSLVLFFSNPLSAKPSCKERLSLFRETLGQWFVDKGELTQAGWHLPVLAHKVNPPFRRQDLGLFRYRLFEDVGEEPAAWYAKVWDRLELFRLRYVRREGGQRISTGVSVQQALARALSRSYARRTGEAYDPESMPLKVSLLSDIVVGLPVTIPAYALFYLYVELPLTMRIAEEHFSELDQEALEQLKNANFLARHFEKNYVFRYAFEKFVSETFQFPSNLGRVQYFDPRYGKSEESFVSLYREDPLFKEFRQLVLEPQNFFEITLPGVKVRSSGLDPASPELQEKLLKEYFRFLEDSTFLAAFEMKASQLEWSSRRDYAYEIPFPSYKNSGRTYFTDSEKEVMDHKRSQFWERSSLLIGELAQEGIRFESLTPVQKQFFLSSFFYLDFLMLSMKELGLEFERVEANKTKDLSLEEASERFLRSIRTSQGI